MGAGDILTRASIWIALAAYTAAQTWVALRGRSTPSTALRLLMAGGAVSFLVHIVAAFHFHHHWSHASALRETAHQTRALTGFDAPWGLYVNYAFALCWLGEAAWAVGRTRCYVDRPVRIRRAVQALFLFMIFNGAVVFAHGPSRALGAILCLCLGACVWARLPRT